MTQLPIDTLIRLAADGELSPDQAEQLQVWMSRHPEQVERVRNQMDAERRLRQRCNSVMQGVQVPAGLTNQIRQAWTNVTNSVESGAEVAGTSGPGNVTIQQAAAPRRRAVSHRT